MRKIIHLHIFICKATVRTEGGVVFMQIINLYLNLY